MGTYRDKFPVPASGTLSEKIRKGRKGGEREREEEERTGIKAIEKKDWVVMRVLF